MLAESKFLILHVCGGFPPASMIRITRSGSANGSMPSHSPKFRSVSTAGRKRAVVLVAASPCPAFPDDGLESQQRIRWPVEPMIAAAASPPAPPPAMTTSNSRKTTPRPRPGNNVAVERLQDRRPRPGSSHRAN